METSALHSRAAARHRQPSPPPPQDHLIKAARHHGYVTISLAVMPPINMS